MLGGGASRTAVPEDCAPFYTLGQVPSCAPTHTRLLRAAISAALSKLTTHANAAPTTHPHPHSHLQQDAIVRVTSTAICGSDLHLYLGSAPGMQSGDILGHEFMGIVEEVGPEVGGLG